MRQQVARLAMHRHRDARPHPLVHCGQLVARRMAGDMDESRRCSVMTSTPRRIKSVLQPRDRASRCPGMMREEKITVSPAFERRRWDGRRRRCAPAPSAARPGCRCRSAAPRRAAGSRRRARSRKGGRSGQIAGFLAPPRTMRQSERPTSATWRPFAAPAAAMVSSRATLEAKQATATRCRSGRSARSGSRARRLPSPIRPATGRWSNRRPWPARLRRQARRSAASSVGSADQRVRIELPVAGMQDACRAACDDQRVGLRDRMGRA